MTSQYFLFIFGIHSKKINFSNIQNLYVDELLTFMFIRAIYDTSEEFTLKMIHESLELCSIECIVSIICSKRIRAFYQENDQYIQTLLELFDYNRSFYIFKLLISVDFDFDLSLPEIILYYFKNMDAFKEKSKLIKLITKMQILYKLRPLNDDTSTILIYILDFYEDTFDSELELIIKRLYNIFDYVIDNMVFGKELIYKVQKCLIFLRDNNPEYFEIMNYLVKLNNKYELNYVEQNEI